VWLSSLDKVRRLGFCLHVHSVPANCRLYISPQRGLTEDKGGPLATTYLTYTRNLLQLHPTVEPEQLPETFFRETQHARPLRVSSPRYCPLLRQLLIKEARITPPSCRNGASSDVGVAFRSQRRQPTKPPPSCPPRSTTTLYPVVFLYP
jgi:hypothetical protein